jgi:predicted ATPase
MLIEEIRVQGYKSLVDATLHVRPLTLLAGTNSSGKSSIMQPLLLIKQTMEAPYQPAGALVLDGAHVQAETAEELISKISSNRKYMDFVLSLKGKGITDSVRKEVKRLDDIDNLLNIELNYGVIKNKFDLISQKIIFPGEDEVELTPFSGSNEIDIQISSNFKKNILGIPKGNVETHLSGAFIDLKLRNSKGKFVGTVSYSYSLENTLSVLFHIPGLRGAPKRSYNSAFFNEQIKGTFDFYVAGAVAQWQQNDKKIVSNLNKSLQLLELTSSVETNTKNANEIEINVNRLPVTSRVRPKKSDMVNIADVGIGVSQVLPILVALIAAKEGQIVYVEQPELHLHPRAQIAMAELLAEAASRGVRVIVETHSSLLLLTIQTLIAQEKIANTDVGLHWFTRNDKGATEIQYVVPDEDGAYGDWPEDFSEIELKAQDAYLTAVGIRHFGEAAK